MTTTTNLDGWWLECGEDHSVLIRLRGGKIHEWLPRSEWSSRANGDPVVRPVIAEAERVDDQPDWADDDTRARLLDLLGEDHEFSYLRITGDDRD